MIKTLCIICEVQRESFELSYRGVTMRVRLDRSASHMATAYLH